MNKANLKSNIWVGVGIAFILGMIVFGILYGTSAECWYAGMHDSKCEKTLYDEPCNCYERLLEADKEQEAKIKNNKEK